MTQIAAPLNGIRVLDWTVLVMGSSCTSKLADLGAEVIHIEERGRGELLRSLKESKGVPYINANGRYYLFEEFNHSKKSLAVDLRKEKGRELIISSFKNLMSSLPIVNLIQYKNIAWTTKRFVSIKKTWYMAWGLPSAKKVPMPDVPDWKT